jgi:hypothetical protein
MITAAVVIIALFVGVVLAVAAAKPDTFRVQRTARIEAAPEKIFPLISDLRSHLAWSPFEKDPAMKRTFVEPTDGRGATYEWEGNRKVGAGRIQVMTVSAPFLVTMELMMFRPFKAHNLVEFTVEPKGDATNVSWAMQGRQPFMAKVMGTLINCDNMVGREFETGLAKLKALAET